jgi:hypothetical protein
MPDKPGSSLPRQDVGPADLAVSVRTPADPCPDRLRSLLSLALRLAREEQAGPRPEPPASGGLSPS